MKKVLLVSMGETFGGIERLELDWMNFINKKEYQLNLLTPNKNTFLHFENEIKNKCIIDLNTTRKNLLGRIKYDIRLFKYLKSNKYDIVHINSGAFFYSFRVALISKLCGIKKVIVHSHSTYHVSVIKRMFIIILNPLYRLLCDNYISCSQDARISLFTNNFIKKDKIIILNNGIDINKYKYNEKTRNALIKKFNLNDKIVYGHTGRFSKQKNQVYLIDLFNIIHQKQKNSVLLLVGDGELREQIIKRIQLYNLEDSVILTGLVNNVNELLNCIDVLILPSLYEGLCISAIESQVNGIITYCSSCIPKEASISKLYRSFSLNDSLDGITDKIINEKRNYKRVVFFNSAKKTGYDIIEVVRKLEKIYKETCEK